MSSGSVRYPNGVSGVFQFKKGVPIQDIVDFLDTVRASACKLGATPLIPACVGSPEEVNPNSKCGSGAFLAFSLDNDKSANEIKKMLEGFSSGSEILEVRPGFFSIVPITLVT